jgi:SAM-dependent methyltransferase
MTIIYIFFGLVGLFLLTIVGWRLASERYSLPCPTWLGWLVEMDSPFTETYRASVIVQRLNLQPGMRVLDVGCGPGRVTIPLAKQVGPRGHVTAIDLQPGMLHRAQAKAQAADLSNIQFLLVGVGEGKLERSEFDRALLVTVLGEIPNRDAALKEIFDALKPGGILSVTEIVFDPHYQSRATILRLAGAVGFREKEFFGNRFAFTLNLEKPNRDAMKG